MQAIRSLPPSDFPLQVAPSGMQSSNDECDGVDLLASYSSTLLELLWSESSGMFSGCTLKGKNNGGCLLVRREIGNHRPQNKVGHPSPKRVLSLVGWIPSWWGSMVVVVLSSRHHEKDNAEYGRSGGHRKYPEQR